MKKGKIVQISGPVIDVEFEDSDLPYIKDAFSSDVFSNMLVGLSNPV